MSVKKSALATACCALLLAAPLALAQSAAAADNTNNGPKTPQEVAACKSVTSTLLGGFGAMLGNAVCVVQPADRG
ncbi:MULTISPECIES: hypothetical protein [Streptomyces]|uniref:hypothetical protein n=1 Tax=Streptomyces TaxID=1883 RepID=UPI0004AAA506|nr:MULTISPECIES: hypothetical protein [Streptomyces]